MFNTAIRKVLRKAEYRAHKYETKNLLRTLPVAAQEEIIIKAYSNTVDMFKGEKGDRLTEFWIAVRALIDAALPLYVGVY